MLYCQKIKIIDQSNKQPISYAIVMIDSTGSYANKNGQFKIPNKRVDHIKVKHIAYYDLTVNKIPENDTLFLKPKPQVLDQVIVGGYDDLKRKRLRSRSKVEDHFYEGLEIVSCYCPKKDLKGYITNLLFDSYLERKDEKLNGTSVLRINTYNNNDLKSGKLKKSYKPKKIKFTHKTDEISFNIKNQPIILDKNGFCLGLEVIELNSKDDGKISSVISHKNRFFKVKSYYKFNLDGKREMVTFREYNRDFEFSGIEKGYFMPEMTLYK